MIFIVGFCSFISLIIYAITKTVTKIYPENSIIRKLKNLIIKFEQIIIHMMHSFIQSGAIPIQVESMKKIGAITDSDFTLFEILPPISILMVFILYPIIIYRFISKNV